MKLVPLTAGKPTPVPQGDLRRATDWDAAATRYHRRVLVHVLSMGVRADRAEEIVQATWSFLIEAERAGRLSHVDLPGLALTQSRFFALHELRRGGIERKLMVSADELAARAVDAQGSPEAELLAKESAARLLRAIELAPLSTQRMFGLLYRDPSLPHAAAAAELGLSLQRVRQLVCELRQLVRETLTERP